MALMKTKIGKLIEQTNYLNSNLTFGENDVMGMTIDKRIIPTKADVKDAELSKYLVVNENEFIYNPRTHGKKIGLGFNNLGRKFIISWNNISFKVKDSNEVLPLYLYMFLIEVNGTENPVLIHGGVQQRFFLGFTLRYGY